MGHHHLRSKAAIITLALSLFLTISTSPTTVGRGGNVNTDSTVVKLTPRDWVPRLDVVNVTQSKGLLNLYGVDRRSSPHVMFEFYSRYDQFGANGLLASFFEVVKETTLGSVTASVCWSVYYKYSSTSVDAPDIEKDHHNGAPCVALFLKTLLPQSIALTFGIVLILAGLPLLFASTLGLALDLTLHNLVTTVIRSTQEAAQK